MRSHAAGHVALASSILVASFLSAIAACGGDGSGGGGAPPETPAGRAASSTTAPSSMATAPVPAGSAGTPTIAAPPAAGAPMRAIAPSAMAEDLRKLGIDPLKPPPLNKLSPDVIRKVMPTFAKSLGVKCEFCHDTNNFKAPTPHKKLAAKMWQEFVVNLAMEDGSPLYCDSCHAGKPELLDRHDKKALSAWMDANYVGKLKRTDTKDHSCETCHGDPFEPKFLAAWEK